MKKIVVMASLSALLCGCSENSVSVDNLTGATWNVIALFNGEELAVVKEDRTPILVFAADSTLSGNTGCNSFNGSYSIEDENLHVSVEAMTMAMCPDNLTEQLYLEQLQMTERFAISSDTLSMLNAEGEKCVVLIKTKN